MLHRLPNFFIIGAMRAGTTSLWRYLAQHPDIFMSPIKETRFFAVKDLDPAKIKMMKLHPFWKRSVFNLSEYCRLFQDAKGEQILGEASPVYMVYPHVAPNIRKLTPHAKILACLRQPVDRAFSHFQHNRAIGVEKRKEFVEAIYDDVRLNYAGYYRLGLYAQQLEYYFNLFPRDQIKICYYDHLMKNPGKILSSIFDFLGVSTCFKPDISTIHNKSAAHEPLDIQTKKLLTLLYMQDIKKLEKLTGADLRTWYTFGPTHHSEQQDMYYSPWYYIH